MYLINSCIYIYIYIYIYVYNIKRKTVCKFVYKGKK